MIARFKNGGTEDVYNGKDSKVARKQCPNTIWNIAARKLELIQAAAELRDLKSPPGNHLEKLKDDREGQHSIRINDQYRICFAWTDEGAVDVEITDYH